MIIGVPKEIKDKEFRVAATPSTIKKLVNAGHTVFVEKNAGAGSGFSDLEYIAQGAKIVDAETAWGMNNKKDSFMVMKIKEPLEQEFRFFREGLLLFTYLHLASVPELTKQLVDKKVNSVAYETVELEDSSLPLLKPMSEVAGKMSSLMGAYYSQKKFDGCGVLPGGITGVAPANYLIIGPGIVGLSALQIASGLGANVTIAGLHEKELATLKKKLPKNCNTLLSTPDNIAKAVQVADVVVGGVLVTGEKAPRIITYNMVKKMKNGAVLVDVSIDQGGCTDVSWPPTSHTNPVRYVSIDDPHKSTQDLDEAKRLFGERKIIVYVVPNMPGAYAKTSTQGITNATLPYALAIANNGLEKAVKKDKALAKGINTYSGFLTCEGVAKAHGMKYTPLEQALKK